MSIGTWRDVAFYLESTREPVELAFLTGLPDSGRCEDSEAFSVTADSVDVELPLNDTPDVALDNAVYRALADGAKGDRLCYDGLPLFSHEHPRDYGVASNLFNADGCTPWVMLRVRDSIGRPVGVVRLPDKDNNQRYSVCYGMPQGACMNGFTPGSSDIEAMCGVIERADDHDGNALGLVPTHVVAFDNETYTALRRAVKDADLADILTVLRAPVTVHR